MLFVLDALVGLRRHNTRIGSTVRIGGEFGVGSVVFVVRVVVFAVLAQGSVE